MRQTGHFVGNLKLSAKDTPGSEPWSVKVRRRARQLVKTLDTGYMELAEILYTVWDTPINGDPKNAGIFHAWGYKSFSDYAEGELGLHRRKAERLRRIWFDLHVRLADMDKKLRRRIIEMGWSKSREIIRVLSIENAEQWVEMAENLSYPELMAAIQKAVEEQEKAGEDDTKAPDPVGKPDDYKDMKPKRFRLFPGQYDTVDSALERASQLSKSDKDSHNLEMICTDFLATNDFRLADDPKVQFRYLAKIETLIGKKLVVINAESGMIEYGLEALELIVEDVEEDE
jgi:hypothetical protein